MTCDQGGQNRFASLNDPYERHRVIMKMYSRKWVETKGIRLMIQVKEIVVSVVLRIILQCAEKKAFK